jgi:hypothetical protein
MKKSVISLVTIAGLTFILHQSLSAQEEQIPGKLFYVELGGPGVYMSANFDSRFNPNERLGFGYRLGAGFGTADFKTGQPNQWGWEESVTRTYYSIPAGLNYVFGKPDSNKTFEVGAGFSFLTRKVSLYNYGNEEKPGNVIGFLTFMYRSVPVNGGYSFRIGFTPIIGTSGDLCPMGSIGFGYAF